MTLEVQPGGVGPFGPDLAPLRLAAACVGVLAGVVVAKRHHSREAACEQHPAQGEGLNRSVNRSSRTNGMDTPLFKLETQTDTIHVFGFGPELFSNKGR